ncbi:hypothetical protein HF290_12285 [Acidithiobacillus ferrooxidans]|jgi:hypothetical protein|uniref:hypothetical protein n=1 Tax=Acidithiobacillus ferrooxidans TaxID=920 RepID=UPI001C07E933|nr:hypothetical protein [Acidithiobacillus ferrooxidans]MBU2861151.1 hypothetical protein [Acidithiobacillus ferrooxidans]
MNFLVYKFFRENLYPILAAIAASLFTICVIYIKAHEIWYSRIIVSIVIYSALFLRLRNKESIYRKDSAVKYIYSYSIFITIIAVAIIFNSTILVVLDGIMTFIYWCYITYKFFLKEENDSILFFYKKTYKNKK